MLPNLLSPLVNHLWQSTLFAGLAALLTLSLSKNRAQMRYWLWLAASVKFLVPFALLVSLGNQFEWRNARVVTMPLAGVIEPISRPLPVMPAAASLPARTGPGTPALLTGVWFCGSVGILGFWFARWRRLRHAARAASLLPIPAPIEIRSSPTRLEPGVFGIFRPVLLLPEGIMDRLTPAQLSAILAHELCHVRRRDNLWSAIHMVVSAIFWFHPLVWWIGARLIEERERACDEEVLLAGNDPETYAAGILNVCRLYLESPLACASGVTGADLRKRIEAIMTGRAAAGLSLVRKVMLAAAGLFVVGGPLAVGVLYAPHSLAQTRTSLKFEVASIKPSDPDSRGMRFSRTPGNGLAATGVTLKALIEFAYNVHDFQLSGGPAWMRTERFDISAKPDRPEGPPDLKDAPEAQRRQLSDQLRERTRSLLAERFQLSVQQKPEERPVYLLTVGKNGHKLHATEHDEGISRNRGRILGEGAAVEMFVAVLASVLGRPVLDRTGIQGKYNFSLEWTEDSVGPKGKDGDGLEPNTSDPNGPSIFSAIQEQLGLRLEAGRGPVPILIIERAEKPSAN